MSKKKVIIVTFLICSLSVRSQNFNYKFCVVQKDATSIAFEFTVCNNTSSAVNPFTFIFNWPGVSNVTVDNGMDVIKNGNSGIVELQKQSWAQPLNPGCNNKFTVRMNYDLGMFPPTWGLLNGDTIQGITCYVPPSYENFKCKKNFSETCFIPNEKEIRIGEGTVRAWNSTRDVYIPTNRKSWAIAMAVAHGMFTNLMGFDCLTPNEYFATAMQESSCGCDGGVTAPAWVTNPYNIQPTNYCADLTHGVAAGFFQEEYGTGWVELEKDIPCFIPTVSFDQFIIGSKFETQALGKVYHDFNNISYWQYIKCWNPIGFIKNSKDPYVTEKMIALGYNRGMNSGEIGNLLTTNRAAAINATNILPYLNPGGVGWVYAEQISRISAVLDNNMGAVDPADPIASSVPYPGVHSFRDFYDVPVSWTDISNYLDAITPMYAGVGLNATTYKAKIKKVFDALKSGGDVSFRYELSSVIDAIVLNLPAFDPKFGLGGMYVNSGGSTCKYPTAALSKSDTVCMGSPLVLTVKLTGTSPWSFSYENPKGAIIAVNNITTSPYTFTVKDTGVYHLVSVTDATGAGEAICEPIVKAYIGNGALANLIDTSTVPCGPQEVQIKFTGTGPFDIEYTINGAAQTPVNGITKNPYILVPATAPVGTYVLTRLKANGCDIKMADTVIIHPLTVPKVAITGNKPLCPGKSLVLSAQSASAIKTYAWSPATGLSSTTTANVTASPLVTTKYVLTITDANGCTAKDSVTLVVDPPPVVKVSPDTILCPGSAVALNASGGDTYSWAPATGLNVSNAASVIASPLVTTQYTVTVTTLNGCVGKDSVKLTVNSSLAIRVSNDTTLCRSANAILTASGGSSYSWAPATGLNTTNTATVIASPLVTTQYTVTVTAAGGCTGKDSVKITVSPPPTVQLSADTTICNTANAVLIASGGIAYSWAPATGLNVTNAATVIASPAITTQYTVTIGSPGGCTNKDSVLVTVMNCSFNTIVSSGSICTGNCFVLSAAVSGGTAPYDFVWQPGGMTGDSINVCPTVTTTYTVTITDKNGDKGQGSGLVKVVPPPVVTATSQSVCKGDPATLTASGALSYKWSTGANTAAITVNPIVNSTYTVTGTTAEGCSDTAMASVFIKQKPVVRFSPDTAGCAPLIVKFSNLSTDMMANATCSWDFGNGVKVQGCSPAAVTYSVAGTYPVSLSVNNDGCIATVERTAVKVYPLPIATFTADPPKTDFYNPTIVFTKDSKDTNENKWSFGDGTTAISNVPEYKHTYEEEGKYNVCLNVTSINKCSGQHCLEVIISPAWSFYIPNAFTPDGDGLNSSFYAKAKNITEYHLMIFDRWGNLLFESENLSEGWDGKINHGFETAKQDVYVYKVSFRDGSNKQRQYIGSVTLLKQDE